MDNSFLTSIVPLVAVFAIMYFLLIRPQQQRAKEHKAMVENVRRGDTVVTAGGIVGKVAKVKDDGEIMVEIANDIQVRVLKSTLSEVRVKGQPADAKADKD
jgi:preprotein translocase subunit YajC